MIDGKPSDLSDILKIRETKINKKHSFTKSVRDYNQPNHTPQKTKKKAPNLDR